MSDPKQHHYIPTTYLEHFCDEAGVLWAHDKWTGESFPSKPASILKEKRYYAQPDHENRTWNNVIENFFSDQIETPWPKTVRLIQSGPRQLSQLYNLYMFLYSLRVRVPNCRKAVEYSLQERVRLAARTIEDEEFLGRERKMVEHFNKALNRNYTCIDELYDDGVVVITIDPHKSLEAMAASQRGSQESFSNCNSISSQTALASTSIAVTIRLYIFLLARVLITAILIALDLASHLNLSFQSRKDIACIITLLVRSPLSKSSLQRPPMLTSSEE